MVYDGLNVSGQYQTYGNSGNYADHSQYGERPPTPPSPSERSDSPPPQQLLPHGKLIALLLLVHLTCIFSRLFII